MNPTREDSLRIAALAVAMMLCGTPPAVAGEHQHGRDHGGGHVHGDASPSGGGSSMKQHPMDEMEIHGLAMALQGSTLLMIGRTKASPTVDGIMVSHGREMFEQGAGMFRDTEAGAGLIDSMEDARKELEKLEASGPAGVADTYRHMLIAMNHALEMAVEGASLAMRGHASSGEGTGKHAVAHGREMIAGGRMLWKEVSEGKAMKEIHAMGMSPKTVRMMKAVHKFAAAGGKVIGILEDASRAE